MSAQNLSSLIKEPHLPDFSASTACALYQAFLALSAATLVSFCNRWYSCTMESSLCCDSHLCNLSQASRFFLDRFLSSSDPQSASTLLGASGKDLPASFRASLKDSHIEFTSDDSASRSLSVADNKDLNADFTSLQELRSTLGTPLWALP